MPHPAQKLRSLLNRPGIIRSLAAHDAFTAKICAAAGIELLFLGGFGAAASGYGLPDLGLLGLADMAEAARRMTQAVDVPVIVDADTGYGSLPNVARTVRELERAGAAGMILEDQVFPKRCGHFSGKSVIPIEEMTAKLQTACDVRNNPDFTIIARTDARATEGLHSAIKRANVYAEIGADVCFVEAPQSRDELVQIGKEVGVPQLANMLTGGATPILSAAELESLGFKIVVAPIETLMATALAVRELAEAMLRDGRVDHLSDRMVSFAELKELLGVADWLALESSRRRG